MIGGDLVAVEKLSENKEESNKDLINIEQINIEQVNAWNLQIKDLSYEERIEFVLGLFKAEDVVIASSLSLEDQVVTRAFTLLDKSSRVFFLDTGRHYEETYKTLLRSREFFGINYEVYAPPSNQVEELVSKKGPYSFYDSVELRKECCHIRKVIPLQRVLATAKLWVTGIRNDQSANREDVQLLEWDQVNGLYKFNPLVEWTSEDVDVYVKEHQLPRNPLFDHGYPSIGCAPCTRKVLPGEDPRRGRWWWEDTSHNECGLHKR